MALKHMHIVTYHETKKVQAFCKLGPASKNTRPKKNHNRAIDSNVYGYSCTKFQVGFSTITFSIIFLSK